MRRDRTPLAYWLFAAAVALALLGWVEANRVDPRTISQAQLHQWATVGRHVSFERWVRVHPVYIAPPDRNVAEMLVGYATRSFHNRSTTETQGVFDTGNGEIQILGAAPRYEASLPFGLRPLFYHTLRHEYGHAAFRDWLDERGTKAVMDPYLNFLRPGQRPNRTYYPPELFPVIDEWEAQDAHVYGLPYLSATFGEYMAESYVRELESHDVPPLTKRFILICYRGVPR